MCKDTMADSYLMVVVALIVIVLTYIIAKKLKKSLNIILLVGLSDAGKTAIFSRIVFNKPKKSVTSLKENEATVSDLNLRLIDLPGAERLRVRLWEQYRAKARQILYIIDSSKLENNLSRVCEHLYQILSDELVHKNNVKFTIVCHKQDLENAKRQEEVKTILGKELNAIKDTKRGQLTKTSEEEDDDYLMSKFDQENISFGSLSVNFIETSINNLDQLIKLIL